MNIKTFKKLANNTRMFTVDEVEEFELMSRGELEAYQNELETDSGALSSWDHLRAFLTMKSEVDNLSEKLKSSKGITKVNELVGNVDDKKEFEERLERLERNQERLIKLWEDNLQIGAVYPFASLTTHLDKILSEMELETTGQEIKK